MTFEVDVEVVVVGNGPAGISLSAFLSGWLPFYDNGRPHPDPLIHERLADSTDSLIDQSLHWYADQQSNPNVGMYSDLIDRLMRPDGAEGKGNRSALRYEFRAERRVSHIVLGDGPVGGSWNGYDDEMATVSLCNWMDLPVLSLQDWMGGQPLIARLPAAIIREYMHDYVKRVKISQNFAEYTQVTNVTKVCSDADEREYWRVRGRRRDGQTFELTCKRVVLACGRNHHRLLGVAGEDEATNVAYNVREMQQILTATDSTAPVVIVGDGISAADAILHCLANNLQICHIFRRSEKQLRQTMLSRLSATVYPEYSKVFELMLGRAHNPLYCRMSSTNVVGIDAQQRVLLHNSELPYRCLVVCVGLRSELSMLEEKHDFLAEYGSAQDASLFAVGSVIGDHFIRYLIGGAFHVAQELNRLHREDQTESAESLPTEEKPLPKRCSVNQFFCRLLRKPCNVVCKPIEMHP